MAESLVRFRHSVGVFLLLVSRSGIVDRVQQLRSKLLTHVAAVACTGSIDDPPHRQRFATAVSDLGRHLIGSSADTAALDFHQWLYVVDGLEEYVQRLLAGLFPMVFIAPYKIALLMDFFPSSIMRQMNFSTTTLL